MFRRKFIHFKHVDCASTVKPQHKPNIQMVKWPYSFAWHFNCRSNCMLYYLKCAMNDSMNVKERWMACAMFSFIPIPNDISSTYVNLTYAVLCNGYSIYTLRTYNINLQGTLEVNLMNSYAHLYGFEEIEVEKQK